MANVGGRSVDASVTMAHIAPPGSPIRRTGSAGRVRADAPRFLAANVARAPKRRETRRLCRDGPIRRRAAGRAAHASSGGCASSHATICCSACSGVTVSPVASTSYWYGSEPSGFSGVGCAMVQRQSMRSAIGDGAPSMLHRQPSISATNPVWVGSKLANTAAPVVMRRDAAGGEYLTIAPPALARTCGPRGRP
ncbi:hypothetical protein Y600_6033 [Burkholderia pseudomallei MSHR3709]|nr:hypothetical protein Y600_6033 [Burkholderia pseudomallei MSHR3709]